jgi:flagellin-like hook-associated protein FlgL
MSGIVLSSATRSSLLAAQDTAALLSQTQNRLATGKKVNSALDNPTNFFTAAGLDSRAGDLSNLLDSISNGIQTINAASTGITNIQKLVDSAKSTANQALSTQITTAGTAANAYAATNAASSFTFTVNTTTVTISAATVTSSDTIDQAVTKLNTASSSNIFSKDSTGTKLVINANSDAEFTTTTAQAALGLTTNSSSTQSVDLTVTGVQARKDLAKQYNSLLGQIDQLARDASYNGVNLLTGTSTKLHIAFNEKDTSNVDVTGVDATSGGLSLSAIDTTTSGKAFLLDTDVKAALTALGKATDTLRSDASSFGSNLTVVQNRQDFTKHLINVLQTGSAYLVNADLNEEAANSQALSTRQSLAVSSLSLANQAQQSVLQLLR